MKITLSWLEKHRACREGLEWVLKQDIIEGVDLVSRLRDYRLDWANWLIVRLMNKKQKVVYAIFAAEQVIEIYEKKYPDDKRPRKAIEAAKAYLKKPCKKTKAAAATAAAAAATAATAATAAYTADTAAATAYTADTAAATAATAAYTAAAATAATAAYTADTAAYTAATAAYTAAAATAAATAAYAAADTVAYAVAARNDMRQKIIDYGLTLIRKEKS